MAEFEEKLNAILGNQEAMGQIMALARSLSGGSAEHQDGEPEQQENPETAPPVQEMPDLSQMLGGLDPRLIQMGMELMRETQGGNDRNTALLQALRPFLREERRASLDRAMQITQMSRLIRLALGSLGGRGEQERV